MRIWLCWATGFALFASGAIASEASLSAPATILEAFAPFSSDPWRACRKTLGEADRPASARWRGALGLDEPDPAPCPTPGLLDAIFAEVGPSNGAGRFARFANGAPSPQALVPVAVTDVGGVEASPLEGGDAVATMLSIGHGASSGESQFLKALMPDEAGKGGDAQITPLLGAVEVAEDAGVDVAGPAPPGASEPLAEAEQPPVSVPIVEVDPAPADAPVSAREPARAAASRAARTAAFRAARRKAAEIAEGAQSAQVAERNARVRRALEARARAAKTAAAIRLRRAVEARRGAEARAARQAAARPAAPRRGVRAAVRRPAPARTRSARTPLLRAGLQPRPPAQTGPQPRVRSFSPKMSSAGPPMTR